MPAPLLDFASDAHLRTAPEDRIIRSIAFRAWPRAEWRRDPDDAQCTLRAAFARWRARGLPCVVDARGQRRYDPAEVAVFMRYAGWKREDPFWREHHVEGIRGEILSFYPPGTARDRAPDPLALPPRHFVVSIERRFEPAWIGPGARLRLPVPMADEALRELAIEFDPVVGAPGELRLASGYAELRLGTAPTGPVTLRARHSFVAHPSPAPDAATSLTPAERDQYLRRSEDLVRVTAEGEAIARSLTDGVTEERERVRRLYEYVAGRRCGDEFPYAMLGLPAPEGVRQIGFYDCQMVAALFVSLCRAVGIPARRVGGYHIYAHTSGFHNWTEAWIDGAGWMPVDSISGEASAVLQDTEWIPFFGAIDYRMKTGILPRLFTGSPGVRMPARWTMLERDTDGAACTDVIDAVTMDVVWSDAFRVQFGEPIAAVVGRT